MRVQRPRQAPGLRGAPQSALEPDLPADLVDRVEHPRLASEPVLATVPAVLLMSLGQRFIVQGPTLGAVK